MSQYANYEWLAKNGGSLDEYAGKWVAVTDHGVVSVANSLKELLKNPEVKKLKPLITKIPRPEEAYSLL